jgi:hypothetical protein
LTTQSFSLTRFGQSLESDRGKPLAERLELRAQATSLIDVVEPFQPAAPGEPAKGEPARAERAWRLGEWPALSDSSVDRVLETTDLGFLPESLGGARSRAQRGLAGMSPTLGLSAFVGIAAMAAGGYHVALRERRPLFSGRGKNGATGRHFWGRSR